MSNCHGEELINPIAKSSCNTPCLLQKLEELRLMDLPKQRKNFHDLVINGTSRHLVDFLDRIFRYFAEYDANP